MSNVYIKTKVRSGKEAMKYLGKYKNKTVLIVCDKFMAENGSVKTVINAIDSSCRIEMFDQAVPDPTTEVVGNGLDKSAKVQPDVVIAFGGGSANDTAKGIIYFGINSGLMKKPIFITIPTTSGTGSEVTSAAVITDVESKSKHLILDNDILADIAILDPTLTLSVPPAVTANTGMDVLTHALEAYVASGANVFSDALSEKAVELLLESLLVCYKDGKNLEARNKMHEASTLAGMAFNTAGLGVNHQDGEIQQPVFQRRIESQSNGLANAMLLTRVIDFNCEEKQILDKYAAMVYKVKLASITTRPQEAVKILKEVIRMMMAAMNMDDSVEKFGVSREDYVSQLDNMTENALKDNCLNTTPRKIGAGEIRQILLEIY